MASVFKLYDIRGIYGKDLTDEIIYKIGFGLGKYFNNYETIGIVRDIRVHSERIRNILASTLIYTHDILDFGVGSTPEAHYLAKVYNIPVLMITASHNPPEYNGIKPINSNGNDLPQEDIKKIEELTYQTEKPSEKVGNIEEENAIELYKWHIKKKFKSVSGFKLGYDPSNSVLSLMKDIVTDLGNEIVPINDKIDGTFPGHMPDPSKDENIKPLKDLMKSKNDLDIGFMFDSDGDRLGIIGKDGERIGMDKYIIPFIKKDRRYVLEISLPIYLRKLIKESGAEDIVRRPGHTFIKFACQQNRAFLGIEYTGHIYFAENDYIDDALFGALMLLKYMKKGFNINNVNIPEFQWIERDIPRGNIDLVQKVKEYGKNNNYTLNDLNGDLDGIELLKDNLRILVRYSETEPLFRIVIDSYKKEIDPEKIYNEIVQLSN
ncbi:phosphomannomutase [Nanobdella aerobiophila]|uniref:Phosphomannomutase n=1 Tax=Nanobdella aerobiophila TaxID=2586965 RepID=A0A915SKI9_9ARCH|nr:hypothetical protein [Nanobdella aerobiophila]BBL45376.1 phosphomannomutase [Nanobdella aerobiophila]